nr:MAG TPA: Receptor Binding Protein [Caudoviricetes sp.]
MAEKSSFFNSVSGDRKYKAEDWASYFGTLIGNGVFPNPATNLQVVPGASGLTVTVHAGKAWINGYYYNNTDDLTLTLPTPDGSKKRIDRIVVRWSLSDRKISAQVKSGTAATNPSAAVLQRDSDVYELAIADVLVGVAATSLSSTSITDRRYDSTLCGVVTGTVQQIDTSAFAAQVQSFLDDSEAEFTSWLDGLQDVLDESTAGNLLNLINTHKADTNNPHQVTAAQIGAATTSAMQTALNGKANTTHNQSASTITAGTLAGKVQANQTAMTGTGAQVRDIVLTTTDPGAGSDSTYPDGTVILVYE